MLRLLCARLGIKIKRNESRAAIKGLGAGGAGGSCERISLKEPALDADQVELGKKRAAGTKDEGEKVWERTMQSAEVHTLLLNLLARNHFDNVIEPEHSRGDFSVLRNPQISVIYSDATREAIFLTYFAGKVAADY